MSIPDAGRVTVVLIGLDGLTGSLLRQALADDRWLSVVQLPEDAPLDALGHEQRAIVVVGATAAQLRRATGLLPRPDQLIATVMVFVEPPGSDIYFVSTAGRNVSSPELAQLVRELATAGRAPHPTAGHAVHDLTRSEP